MEARDSATLLSVASPWPIAINLAHYLPAGDLINLARTSVPLRAALHGFQAPSAADLQVTSRLRSRAALHIGNHQTSYWKQLKQAAPFLCASPTHTRGSSPRPCRYCSTPICEACIVRDSLAKRAENTFKNRCRFLCKSCWNTGNPHKRCRFTGAPTPPLEGPSRYNFAPGDGEFCACTIKDDSWVCISCKDMQNAEANLDGYKLCFGVDCSTALEEDKDRRRICLWCDRPMLRGRASMESRLAFDQKMQDARAQRDLNFEERTGKQQKLYKMSRRELRGDEAVAQDPLADVPQFVRHLDTVNYQRFMRRDHAPSGDHVYRSKLGSWVYNQRFLLEIGRRCKRLPKRDDVRYLTKGDGEQQERTNLEKSEQRSKRRRKKQDGEANCTSLQETGFGSGLHRKSNELAAGVEFQHLRHPYSIPAEAEAINHVDISTPESSSLPDVTSDYAIALALQAEIDQEMAEALDAELVAGTVEDTVESQSDREPADSRLDKGPIKQPSASCIFAPEGDRGIQDRQDQLQSNEDGITTSKRQLQRNIRFENTSSLKDNRNLSAPSISDSLIAPEDILASEIVGSEQRKPALPPIKPETDIDESDNGAHMKHSQE